MLKHLPREVNVETDEALASVRNYLLVHSPLTPAASYGASGEIYQIDATQQNQIKTIFAEALDIDIATSRKPTLPVNQVHFIADETTTSILVTQPNCPQPVSLLVQPESAPMYMSVPTEGRGQSISTIDNEVGEAEIAGFLQLSPTILEEIATGESRFVFVTFDPGELKAASNRTIESTPAVGFYYLLNNFTGKLSLVGTALRGKKTEDITEYVELTQKQAIVSVPEFGDVSVPLRLTLEELTYNAVFPQPMELQFPGEEEKKPRGANIIGLQQISVASATNSAQERLL